jgi:hypothetical protein
MVAPLSTSRSGDISRVCANFLVCLALVLSLGVARAQEPSSSATLSFVVAPAESVEVRWLTGDDPRSPEQEHAPTQTSAATYGAVANAAITGWIFIADGTCPAPEACTGWHVSLSATSEGSVGAGNLRIATDLLAVDGTTYRTTGGVVTATAEGATLDKARVIVWAPPAAGSGAYIVRTVIHVDATYALPGESTIVLALSLTGDAPV